MAAAPLRAQSPPCPRGDLPAYAHNDYENARPLADAIESALRGVEVDLFLVDGQLRVGHDRRTAARGGTLDSVYLQPLSTLAARCGRLTADERPFLLLLELKEQSRPAYDALIAQLAGHGRLLGPREAPDGRGVAEVVLVGWTPAGSDPWLIRQHRITSHRDTLAEPGVRLLSLDYGKTMGRWWRMSSGRRRWLATLRSARRANPGLLLRVHNVPVDARLYATLLEAGVDLLGTKDPVRTRAALMHHGEASSPSP